MVAPGVVISGLKETMILLKEFEPEMSKEINKRMTTAATLVRDAARADIPSGDALSNWGRWTFSRDGRDFGFVGSWVKNNIKLTRTPGRNRGVAVTNYIGLVSKDAAGVIYQTTGHASKNEDGSRKRKKPLTSQFGTSFVSVMNNQHPGKRGLWKAYDEDEGKATALIEAAAKDAEAIVQAKLNSLGG